MNAAGPLIAIGGNAAAPIAIGAINAVGIVSFAGVNAIGVFGFGGVNTFASRDPIVGAASLVAYAVMRLVLALSRGRAEAQAAELIETPGIPAGAIELSGVHDEFEGWVRADAVHRVATGVELRSSRGARAFTVAHECEGALLGTRRARMVAAYVQPAFAPVANDGYREAAVRSALVITKVVFVPFPPSALDRALRAIRMLSRPTRVTVVGALVFASVVAAASMLPSMRAPH